jgi:hypothetical protein
VAAQPEVKAVVLQSKVAADDNPSAKVVGPASLVPAAPVKP